MLKNEKLEWLVKSVGIGVALFFSSVLFLMITNDMTHLELFSQNLLWILGGYVIGAVLIIGFFSLKWVRKASFLFSGAASMCWVFLIFTMMSLVSAYIPGYIRSIVLVNVLMLAAIHLGDYLYMRHVSKELNRGAWKQDFVMLMDLDEKPKNEDEFMEQVERYCQKNLLELEVVHYGIPAMVRLDGQLHVVKLQNYSSMANGCIWGLEFKAIAEE